MKTIFNNLLNKFKCDFPEINWVDYDKGQMNYERPPVAFPCALISIQVQQAENLNSHLQVVNAVVTVKLCFDYTGNTSLSTYEPERLKSLAYLDLVEKVYKQLQGWSTSEFNPLSRINNFDEQRPDNYKVNTTQFKTTYHESTN